MIKNFRNQIGNPTQEETVVNNKVDTSYLKNIEHKPLTSKLYSKEEAQEIFNKKEICHIDR